MPRWKDLPEGLDPEVREFTEQLRGLVDRSGMGIAAVSDRTGYSRTSWERYLNGRLLAPRGAVVALAEATGTSTVHVTTMWELAERAWSRAEMRHDMTIEAIRISQAREALGGSGGQGPARGTDRTGRGHGRAAAAQGGPIPYGQAPGRQSYDRPGSAGDGPYGPAAGSWQGEPEQAGSHGASGAHTGRRSGKAPFVVAAAISVLIVGAGGWFLVDGGDGDGRQDRVAPTRPATPTPSSSPQRPADVKCSGADCAGQDPQQMGCGGEYAQTVSTAKVGTAVIEVRHSQVCGAAWARITDAAVGDSVELAVADKAEERAQVHVGKDAYTPMAAAPDPDDVKACASLKTGTQGCTSAR